METVTLKREEKLLKDIDGSIKNHRYSTRTEFIRDAIRSKLSNLEKEEAIRKLAGLKGTLTRKTRMDEEKAGELAFMQIAKKLNLD
ncbi:MAG: ribbon-helix-helix domain-containing protein [Candidatus Nanoarchaeia archaeon]|nr:ribbon-helix-helix domain-containing protein [Candidatus Nanoarchaeia archaeon]